MSAENLNRTSDVIESPAVIEIPRVNVTPKIVKNTRVNVDVLKQRIIEQKKKRKIYFCKQECWEEWLEELR